MVERVGPDSHVLMLVLPQLPTETRRYPSTPVSLNQHPLPGPRTAPLAPSREPTKKWGAAKGLSLLSLPAKVGVQVRGEVGSPLPSKPTSILPSAKGS